jgi:hypothetical protein
MLALGVHAIAMAAFVVLRVARRAQASDDA